MYGFIIPDKGLALLHGLLAGETFAITRCMVGTGQVGSKAEAQLLTDLVQPIAQATSTKPLVRDNQVDFTVEYRNDLHGGLDTEFYLSEIGIFARDADGAEVMVYYGTLGDYAIRVQPYAQKGLVIRDFPVSIALSDEPEVVIEYNAGAYMTAQQVADYCTIVVLPQFLTEAATLIDAHNADPAAHPYILGITDQLDSRAQQVADYCTIVVLPQFLTEAATLIDAHNADPAAHPYILGITDQLDSRVSLIELQYSTDVNGNPFRVTFENLDSVDVQGVWNQPQARIEF